MQEVEDGVLSAMRVLVDLDFMATTMRCCGSGGVSQFGLGCANLVAGMELCDNTDESPTCLRLVPVATALVGVLFHLGGFTECVGIFLALTWSWQLSSRESLESESNRRDGSVFDIVHPLGASC